LTVVRSIPYDFLRRATVLTMWNAGRDCGVTDAGLNFPGDRTQVEKKSNKRREPR